MNNGIMGTVTYFSYPWNNGNNGDSHLFFLPSLTFFFLFLKTKKLKTKDSHRFLFPILTSSHLFPLLTGSKFQYHRPLPPDAV